MALPAVVAALGPPTLRTHLVKLIFIGLAPLIIFSAILIVLFARQEQVTLTLGLQETTRALSAAVEKEFQANITMLEALASLEALDAGAVKEFSRSAWRVLNGQPNWAGVALFDTTGVRLLANTNSGVSLAALDRGTLNQVIQHKRPSVGEFSGGLHGRVQISVPVVRENKVIHVLTAALDRDVFAAILLRQKLPADWIGTILDDRRVVVARTLAPEASVGQPAGSLLQQSISPGGEKIFTGKTREGIFSYAAVSTLPYFGWSVALIVPATQVSGLLWRSLASIIGAAVLCCLAGFWLASRFARGLADPIRKLAQSAKALGEGRLSETPPALAIVELNDVSQNLQRAAELLREQSRERDRIEAELRDRDEFLERQAQLLRNSEEVLRRQAGELEQQLLASGRLVAVGELTASMAHEFNNPLGIILGFAQGLLAEMDPADPNIHHVQIIAEEARRCEKLVQELLEFGRPRKAEFTELDVKPIVEKTLDLISNRAAKSRVGTSVSVAADLPRVRADMQQIQQMLLNLSLNAIDAMPQGGQLTLGAAKDGSSGITLIVADTGAGISSEMLRRIFQPFYTANKRRGLGLGLPICDRIAKAHGGSISVESQPNRGTTFRIHIPFNVDGDVSATAEQTE